MTLIPASVTDIFMNDRPFNVICSDPVVFVTGKRKSQKSLKSRLFGKKRKEGEGERKLSQSVSNMEGDGLGSEEDLV